MKKIVSTLLILLYTTTVYSASIGTITEQTAAPGSIIRNKNTISGTKGTGIEMLDAVNTTKGKVGITFEDATRVEVNENSKLVIDDFVYDPKKGSGKLAMKFAEGTVRYASGAIAHKDPNSVNINTPSATIAVRGTDFTATVDEVGASTIILLPSCPKGWADIDRDCKTGIIDVINNAGTVTLNKPFQGTRVENRNTPPLKPTILNLNLDTINNLLIVSPPKEIAKQQQEQTTEKNYANMLQTDVLNSKDLLKDELAGRNEFGDNPLMEDLLSQNFLANIFSILEQQIKTQRETVLKSALVKDKDSLLPDYDPNTGVKASVGATDVTLCKNDGSNNQCIKTPRSQNSTIIQGQGPVSIQNRVNSGGNTSITVIQK